MSDQQGCDDRNLIYGLRDPRDGRIRYVGMTECTVDERLRGHLKTARRPSDHCRNWIKSLLNRGLRPEPFVSRRASRM